jgi:chromosome segregation ATPase
MADDTHKMLRAIINGQSVMKSELLGEIRKVDKKVDHLENEMNKGFSNVDKKLTELTKRVDKIGLTVARLEEDAPTIEEFDKLEARVKKVEVKVASV